MLTRMLFVFSVVFSASLDAGVYRWVDANGRTHFGDRPPAEAASKEVTLDSSPADPDNLARERQQKMNDFLKVQQQEREARQAATAKAEKQSAEQAKMCNQMRARLKHMKSISTFYNLNEQGERVFVSEAENQRIRDRFREKVQQTCSR